MQVETITKEPEVILRMSWNEAMMLKMALNSYMHSIINGGYSQDTPACKTAVTIHDYLKKNEESYGRNRGI